MLMMRGGGGREGKPHRMREMPLLFLLLVGFGQISSICHCIFSAGSKSPQNTINVSTPTYPT